MEDSIIRIRKIQSRFARAEKKSAQKNADMQSKTTVSVRMNKKLKHELKELFATHGMNLSEGISKSMDCLLLLNQNKSILITSTQVIPYNKAGSEDD